MGGKGGSAVNPTQMADAYKTLLPAIVASTVESAGKLEAQKFSDASKYSDPYAALQTALFSKYGPLLNQIGQDITTGNRLTDAGTDLDVLQRTGVPLINEASLLNRQLNPERYAQIANMNERLDRLFQTIGGAPENLSYENQQNQREANAAANTDKWRSDFNARQPDYAVLPEGQTNAQPQSLQTGNPATATSPVIPPPAASSSSGQAWQPGYMQQFATDPQGHDLRYYVAEDYLPGATKTPIPGVPNQTIPPGYSAQSTPTPTTAQSVSTPGSSSTTPIPGSTTTTPASAASDNKKVPQYEDINPPYKATPYSPLQSNLTGSEQEEIQRSLNRSDNARGSNGLAVGANAVAAAQQFGNAAYQRQQQQIAQYMQALGLNGNFLGASSTNIDPIQTALGRPSSNQGAGQFTGNYMPDQSNAVSLSGQGANMANSWMQGQNAANQSNSTAAGMGAWGNLFGGLKLW